MIFTYFKDSDFDFDRFKYKTVEGTIIVDAHFINIDQKCPLCDSFDVSKNGHTTKTIFHCLNYLNPIKVKLHIQRFKCKNCSQVFYEKDTFSAPGLNISKDSLIILMDLLLKPNETFKSVGDILHLSKQHVRDIFDKTYYYEAPVTLPEIICIDEKYINKAMTERSYICVLLDFKTKEIYDVYRRRHKEYISRIFSKYPREERLKVKYVIMDMWESYRDLARVYFPNAKIAIDSFHVLENITRAMNKIRCSVQARYNDKSIERDIDKPLYYFLKHFDYFFTTDFDDLPNHIKIPLYRTSWSKWELRKYLLSIDEKLAKAYNLVMEYKEFNKTATIENAKEKLNEIIESFYKTNLPFFNDVLSTLITWKEYIINSFITIEDEPTLEKRRLSNGPIEGRNAIIEQILINGKGFTDFEIFRKRIIYVSKKQIKICKKQNIKKHK